MSRASAHKSVLQPLLIGLVLFCSALVSTDVGANDAPGVFKEGTSGDAVCTRCHGAAEKKPVLAIHQTRHGVAGQPGCQACHGSSRGHVRHADDATERPAPDFVFSGLNKSSAEIQSRTCLNCHNGGKRSHWAGSVHPGNDVSCASCHEIHIAQDQALAKQTQREVCFACHKTQRAQIHYLSTHPIAAGKIACSDCHNAHGATGPKLLVRNTINDTCFGCHADKRGPFLWEHPPASDDCSHCHVAHGSNIVPLLKARPPWLCQGCHAGTIHTTPAFSGRALPTQAGGTAPSAQLLLRACVNCHSAIHGSNHPSGPRFTR